MESAQEQRVLAGSDPQTTNNRMELIAAIEALDRCTPDQSIRLITDSEYLRKGITEWLSGWKSRGWKTAARKPVKNRDLWEALDALALDRNIEWRWVKGHSGDPGNEHADRLANEAIDRMQGGRQRHDRCFLIRLVALDNPNHGL